MVPNVIRMAAITIARIVRFLIMCFISSLSAHFEPVIMGFVWFNGDDPRGFFRM